MAITKAQKASRYRDRHAAGRFNAHLDPAIVLVIEAIATQLDTTKKAVVEAAVTHFQDQLSKD